jgi:hypothetical protein
MTRWGGDAVTPYEANRPVVSAGVAIRPGDYVFADVSGAAVIPAGDVRAVLHAAYQVVLEDAESVDTNSLTSSLPYGLKHARRHGLTRPGDIALIVTVGSGVQVGCSTYRFCWLWSLEEPGSLGRTWWPR